MGALWGGEAEEAKLQSSTAWQPVVYSDPLSRLHLDPEKSSFQEDVHLLPETIGDGHHNMTFGTISRDPIQQPCNKYSLC